MLCERCGRTAKGDTVVTLTKGKQLVIKYVLCETCKKLFLKWLYRK